MRVNKLVAGAVLSAMLGLQGWLCMEVIDLKVHVALLTERVTAAYPVPPVAAYVPSKPITIKP